MTLFEAQDRSVAVPRTGANTGDSGDLSWSVPIPLPPALLQPEVGITYSSAGGHHTWISRGWSVQAGMSIQRIEGVEETHAYADLPDVHRVSGGGLAGLVFPDGPGGEWLYSSTGTLDARFERIGDTWKVSHGGVTTWLAPDQTDPPGWPVSWHTVRARDALGNTVDYEWEGPRLEAVWYGGASDAQGAMLAGQPHLVGIDMVYGPRDHASLRAQGGSLDVIDQRLESVVVSTSFATGALRAEAELDLIYRTEQGEQVLQSVVRRGTGSGDMVLASFRYAGYASIGAVTVEDAPSSLSTGRTVVRGYDYPAATDTLTGQYETTGDGLADVLTGADGWWGAEDLLWAADETATWDGARGVVSPETLTCGLDWAAFPELGCDDPGGTLERTYTLRCGEQRSLSFATRRLVDVDGDGFLDLVETDREIERSPYDPRVALPVDFCEEHTTIGGATFTIHYGDRDGIGAEWASVDSPVPFPRIGQGVVTKDLLVSAIPSSMPGEDAVVDMLDMNADGWLDLVEVRTWAIGAPPSLYVATHEGGRSGGWAAPVRVSAHSPDLEAVLGSLESSKQYVNTAVLSVYDSWRQQTPQIRQIEVNKGLRDLNGDGFLDYVDATKGGQPGWRVWFGTGRVDEGRFVGPIAWAAPLSYLGLTDEGQARVLSCRVTDGGQGGSVAEDPDLDVGSLWEAIDASVFGGEITYSATADRPQLACSGLGGDPGGSVLDLGSPQQRLVGLLDMDGDGRDDLVDTRSRVWWRNLGDGFSATPTALPGFFPGALDASMSQTIVFSGATALFGDVPPAEGEHVVYPSRTTRHGMSAVLDLDRDGLPDLVDLGDPDDDLAVPQVTYHPRGAARPGLLVLVETTSGALTTVAYTSSSRMEPAGMPDTLQEMASHRDVVTRLGVVDPVTGFEGEQSFEYLDGRCVGGRCQGFAQRLATTAIWDPELDAPGAYRPTLGTDTLFLLDRDHAVPIESATYLPGPVVGGFQTWAPSMESATTYMTVRVGSSAGPHAFVHWPETRAMTEYGPVATDSTRTAIVELRRDPWGHVTRVNHRQLGCAAVPSSWQRPLPNTSAAGPSCGMSHVDDAQVDVVWASGADRTHFVLSRMTTSGWDESTQSFVPLEQGEFAYDDLPVGATITAGLVTSQRVMAGLPSDLGAEVLEWGFVRTSRGAVTQTRGPAGYYEQVLWGYGDALPTRKMNGEGHTWEYGEYDGLGRCTVSRDPNGVFTEQSWDVHGRPLQARTTPVGGQSYLVSSWSYSDAGELSWRSQTLWHYGAPGAAGVGRVRYERLDGFGDVVQTWEPAESDKEWIVTETWRDVAGNVVRTGYPHRRLSWSTKLASTRDPRTLKWREVDGFGRPTREFEDFTAALGRVTYKYGPGWTLRATDGAYEKITHDDSRGRLIAVYDGQPSFYGVDRTAHYRYDARGRVAVFTDADSNRYDYLYDGAGRLREVGRTASRSPAGESLLAGEMYWDKQDPVLGGRLEYPLAGPERQTWYAYSYDGPHPIEMWEGPADTGVLVVEWWYDTLGRPLLKHVLDRSTQAFDAYTWTWDGQWIGARDAITDPWGTTTYTYGADAFGERGLLRETKRRWWNGRIATLGFGYDFGGRPTRTTWPSGTVVYTEYTAQTRWLQSHTVSAPAGSATVTYDYDEWGFPSGFHATGSSAWFEQVATRDTPTRLAALDWTTARVDAGGNTTTTTRSLDYTWASNGLLLAKGISGVGEITYGYDGMRRLTSVFMNDTGEVMREGYTYDPLGNLKWMFREGEGSWQYTTGRFSEPVKRRNTDSNTEDRHTWDTQGRLASWDSFSAGGAVTTQRDYVYDGMGRLELVSRTQGYSVYGYDADDQMVVERHPTSWPSETVYKFHGVRQSAGGSYPNIEEVLPMVAVSSGYPRFRFVEPDGHALEVFSIQGEQKSFEVLGAYGRPIAVTPAGSWPIDGYHGQQEDNRNSLVPMGVRHMVLRDGMWMQPEPLLYLGPTNGNLLEPTGYTGVYAGGMPTMMQDRSGRFASLLVMAMMQSASERFGKPVGQVTVVDVAADQLLSTYEAVVPGAYAPTPTTQAEPRTLGQDIDATLFLAAPLAGALERSTARAVSGTLDDAVELIAGASKARGAVADTPGGGRFIIDPKGNALIEPPGGSTVGNKTGTFVETRYPNGSPAQQLHSPKGEPAHGHGFQEGAGPNQRGPSLDVEGNVVPEKSPEAHWEVKQ